MGPEKHHCDIIRIRMRAGCEGFTVVVPGWRGRPGDIIWSGTSTSISDVNGDDVGGDVILVDKLRLVMSLAMTSLS